MNQEERNQQIKDLMISIRRNTQGSKCIDIFEILLNDITDKEVVDSVIVDTHRFITDFSRLCKDVDNMRNLDFISRILTYEFIQPQRCFRDSRKMAQMYLSMYDILQQKYTHPIYTIEKKITLPNENRLGNLERVQEYSTKETFDIMRYFGDLSDLSVDDVKERLENSRKVVLLYNYIPAIVKALIQTKRRGLHLDKNSKMFE